MVHKCLWLQLQGVQWHLLASVSIALLFTYTQSYTCIHNWKQQERSGACEWKDHENGRGQSINAGPKAVSLLELWDVESKQTKIKEARDRFRNKIKKTRVASFLDIRPFWMREGEQQGQVRAMRLRVHWEKAWERCDEAGIYRRTLKRWDMAEEMEEEATMFHPPCILQRLPGRWSLLNLHFPSWFSIRVIWHENGNGKDSSPHSECLEQCVANKSSRYEREWINQY